MYRTKTFRGFRGLLALMKPLVPKKNFATIDPYKEAFKMLSDERLAEVAQLTEKADDMANLSHKEWISLWQRMFTILKGVSIDNSCPYEVIQTCDDALESLSRGLSVRDDLNGRELSARAFSTAAGLILQAIEVSAAIKPSNMPREKTVIAAVYQASPSGGPKPDASYLDRLKNRLSVLLSAPMVLSIQLHFKQVPPGKARELRERIWSLDKLLKKLDTMKAKSVLNTSEAKLVKGVQTAQRRAQRINEDIDRLKQKN